MNFLQIGNLKVAVNASFWDAGSPYADIWGLVVSGGSLVSAPDQGWPFNTYISLTSDKIAIMDGGGTIPPGAYHTVAGAEYLVQNGVIVNFNTNIQPHTMYGLSQDSKYLIMVVVDGRQPGWSEGCNYPEAAQWLIDFGVYNGLMMDGGGSTCMVREDIGICNSPCYGYSRPVPDSLGVYSAAYNKQGPDACAMNANRVDLVTRGTTNHLVVRTWTSSGGWGSLVDVGGSTNDQPAIVSRGDGILDIFYRGAGANNQLWTRHWTTAGGWGSETCLGGSIISGPSACRMNANRLDVVARGSDNAVKHISWTTAGGWSAWESLGGGTIDVPGICSRQDGILDVFYRGGDSRLWNRYWYNNAWSGETRLDANTEITSGPTAVSRDGSHTDVFVCGSGYNMLQKSWNGTWGGFVSLGGPVSRVGVCSPNSTTIKNYHRRVNDHLCERTWTSAGGWGAWTDIGLCF